MYEKPFITHRYGQGEYSTVTLPNGVIETCWFGDDGSSAAKWFEAREAYLAMGGAK